MRSYDLEEDFGLGSGRMGFKYCRVCGIRPVEVEEETWYRYTQDKSEFEEVGMIVVPARHESLVMVGEKACPACEQCFWDIKGEPRPNEDVEERQFRLYLARAKLVSERWQEIIDRYAPETVSDSERAISPEEAKEREEVEKELAEWVRRFLVG